MFTKCKDVKRFDPGKDVNKLFKNVFEQVAYSEFFLGGMEGEQILIFFPAELLQGKSINKNSSKRVGGNATPKISLKFRQRK